MVTIQAEDLYERLGIARTASRDEVKRAYRALLRVYPPERAPEEFKRIREAYETLGDEHSRAEYDRMPSASIRNWIRLASEEMKAEAYPEAERYLKLILLEEPDLDYVRNWLGLCYLYQEKGVEALALYEALLRGPEPAPQWYGNAAHAYRIAGRVQDAERMFRQAIVTASAAEDDAASYFIGLANLYLEQKDYASAERTLEQAIRHDGEVDFADLQFFTRLLESKLYQQDLPGIAGVLARLEQVCADDEQQRYVAWKLGTLGVELVGGGAFEPAVLISQAARRLQPADADYDALANVAQLLKTRQVQAVLGVVSKHPSFQSGGWLASLEAPVREHCSEIELFREMKPVSSPPTLLCVNSIGTRLYGRRDHDPRTQSFIATLYFVILFIPVFPIACYRVIQRGEDSWSFLGKVPVGGGEKKHRAIALAAFCVLVLWMGGSGEEPARGYDGSDPGAFNSYAHGFGPGTSAAPVTDTMDMAGTMPAADAESAAPARTVLSRGSRSSDDAAARAERSWLVSEKTRLEGMQSDLRRMQRELEGGETEIETLRSRIREIERMYPDNAPESEYQRHSRLVDSANALVRAHNARVLPMERLYSEFSDALDVYNQRLAEFNARP